VWLLPDGGGLRAAFPPTATSAQLFPGDGGLFAALPRPQLVIHVRLLPGGGGRSAVLHRLAIPDWSSGQSLFV